MIIYYLYKSIGEVWEINSEDNVDLSDHPDFVLLSEEQIAFYLECKADEYVPNRVEVENCTRMQPDTPAPIDLLSYKRTLIDRLDQLSLFTSGQLSPAYRRENAKVSLAVMAIDPEANTIYDQTTSEEIIREANRIGLICKNEFHRIEALILAAESPEDVDAAFNSHQYNTIISNEQ